jgi:hypothetical protein
MLSASQKHTHPTSEDATVVDWRFSSEYFESDNNPFNLNLKQNLDEVFNEFCLKISGKEKQSTSSIQSIILVEQQKKQLQSEINTLESQIKNSKQFNKKVELNIQLQSKLIAIGKLTI